MKNSVILFSLLIVLFLSGCAAGNPAPFDNTNVAPSGGKKMIVQKDRYDNWTGENSFSGVTAQKLIKESNFSQAVSVVFSEETKRDKWDSYKGGADIEYAFASVLGDAPEAVRGIIDDYNTWVSSNVETELKQASERWDLYNSSDPDGFIALTPRVGMKLMRCDTSIISYVSSINRYNREYEPDDDYFFGHTFDSQSGREMLLNDFITDPEKFTELLCQSLKTANSAYPATTSDVFLEEGFKKRVLESIKGYRADGLFAWSVSPVGFEIYISDPFYKSEFMVHDIEHAFIPFSYCQDILFQPVEVSYDYICPVSYRYIAGVYGLDNRLEGEKEKGYYSAYMGQKDGKKYLYLSGDNETLTYIVNDKPEYVDSIFGEIKDGTSNVYEQRIDPKHFTMSGEANLVRELLELEADAEIGQEGTPELKGLFHSQYGIEPMSVCQPFEAEVFSDENDSEPEIRMLKNNTWMNFLRTDAKTFIDLELEGGSEICRLYVTGNDKDGFMVNGHPAEEVLNLQGWLEE